jgi:F0F1-type ATP synthase epsilon subunit
MAKDKYLNTKVRDAQKVIFEGQVDRISSFNEVGPFDIYPMHANFISIIQKGLTLYKDGKVVKEVEFEKAVMKVKKDTAKIFLGIETFDLQDEINQNLQELSLKSKSEK